MDNFVGYKASKNRDKKRVFGYEYQLFAFIVLILLVENLRFGRNGRLLDGNK